MSKVYTLAEGVAHIDPVRAPSGKFYMFRHGKETIVDDADTYYFDNQDYVVEVSSDVVVEEVAEPVEDSITSIDVNPKLEEQKKRKRRSRKKSE